jgi:hypothetical protein
MRAFNKIKRWSGESMGMKEKLTGLLGLIVMLFLLSLPVLYIDGLMLVAGLLFGRFLVAGGLMFWGVLITSLIALLLSIFKRTRAMTSFVLLISSYILGTGLFLYSTALVYYNWGFLWTFVGIFILGIGEYLFALVIFLLAGDWFSLIFLLSWGFITYFLRVASFYLAESHEATV